MSRAMRATVSTLRRPVAKLLPTTSPPATPWRARHADEDYGAGAEPDWRELAWPEHLAQVEIGGVPINYVDIGEEGDLPVVLVHGLGGQWQNWLENIPRLARQRRVLALDLYGHGCSGMPAEKITIQG